MLSSTFISTMSALIFLLAPTVALKVVESTPQRRLQNATFRYRANYTADFQYLTSPSCDGDPPVLEIICYGPNLFFLGTSNDTIRCTEIPEGNSENQTTFHCVNSCNETECESVYRYQSNTTDYLNGPFGSITFMCEGDTLAQVEAGFKYFMGKNSNGTCAAVAVASNVTIERYNYHVARMGVSCPAWDGGPSREYVYDDTYFDCMDRLLFTTDLDQDNAANDTFGCVSGEVCDAQECLFSFEQILIRTVVPNFYDSCVESSSGPISAYPTAAPVPSTAMYSAQFEASWALLMNPRQAACTVDNRAPIVTVQCGNGATIQFINSSDPVMNCQNIVDNELSCSARNQSIVNHFVSVFYECAGPKIPTSAITYPQSEAFCENNAKSILIRQAVTLGVYCENVTSWYLYDSFVECALAENQFSKTINQYGANDTRYVCSESASFAAGSLPNNTKLIPNVTIATDESWLMVGDRYQECRIATPLSPVALTLTPVPTTLAAPMSPFSVPVTTGQPTTSGTIPLVPSTKPSSVQNSQSIMPPSVSTPAITTPVQQSSDSFSSSKGIVIGVVAGALGALALVAVGWWLGSRRRHEASMMLAKSSSLQPTVPPPPAVMHISPTVVPVRGGRNLSFKDQIRSVEDAEDLQLGSQIRSVPLAMAIPDASGHAEPPGVRLNPEDER